MTTVYVEEFPDEDILKDKLHARRVGAGGRLRIVKPKDEGVFQYIQERMCWNGPARQKTVQPSTHPSDCPV